MMASHKVLEIFNKAKRNIFYEKKETGERILCCVLLPCINYIDHQYIQTVGAFMVLRHLCTIYSRLFDHLAIGRYATTLAALLWPTISFSGPETNIKADSFGAETAAIANGFLSNYKPEQLRCPLREDQESCCTQQRRPEVFSGGWSSPKDSLAHALVVLLQSRE